MQLLQGILQEIPPQLFHLWEIPQVLRPDAREHFVNRRARLPEITLGPLLLLLRCFRVSLRLQAGLFGLVALPKDEAGTQR